MHIIAERQSLGGLGSHGIGLVEQQVALSVVGEGRKHGHHPGIQNCRQGLSIHLLHVSGPAHVVGHMFHALHHVHVGPGNSQGIHLVPLQQRYQLLVHQSGIDHCEQLQGVVVDHRPAANHACVHPHFVSKLRGEVGSTVNQQFFATNGRKSLDKGLQGVGILNDFPTHLHNSQFIFHHRASLSYWLNHLRITRRQTPSDRP